MDEITDKSREIMGRTLAFVHERYGHLLDNLPGGRRFGLDEYDLMPVQEPIVRRNKFTQAHPWTWDYHLSKGGHLRDKQGRKPRRKYRTKRINSQHGCAWTHCQNTKRRQTHHKNGFMIGNWSYSDEGGFR